MLPVQTTTNPANVETVHGVPPTVYRVPSTVYRSPSTVPSPKSGLSSTLRYYQISFLFLCCMKKYVRPLLYGLLALLVLAQLYRPERNLSNIQTNHVSTKYPVPNEVEAILKPACYDCHSNLTVYPWYAEFQPIASWLAGHVNEGKRKLNLSEFTNRKIAVQNHKFEEIIEMVKEGEMPLKSYTWTHGDAKLSQQQQQILVAWAQANMDSLAAQYPADSLVLRRK